MYGLLVNILFFGGKFYFCECLKWCYVCYSISKGHNKSILKKKCMYEAIFMLGQLKLIQMYHF